MDLEFCGVLGVQVSRETTKPRKPMRTIFSLSLYLLSQQSNMHRGLPCSLDCLQSRQLTD